MSAGVGGSVSLWWVWWVWWEFRLVPREKKKKLILTASYTDGAHDLRCGVVSME